MAIEIDINCRTRFNNYQALRVPELWRWNGSKLKINVLFDGKYVESNTISIFPNLPIYQVIPQYLMLSKANGRNGTMKAFRTWVRQQIGAIQLQLLELATLNGSMVKYLHHF